MQQKVVVDGDNDVEKEEVSSTKKKSKKAGKVAVRNSVSIEK